jgi:AAT family amino acid transporter
MTTIESEETSAARRSAPRTLPWYAFGLATLAVVFVLSLATWYLLIDPEWSPLGIYPQPFLALVFWGLIAVVWLGFNLEWHGFDRLRQPWRGLALILTVCVLATGITLAFALGYGSLDPTFAGGRAEGTGYLAGALWVLFGFFFYVMSVVNWGNWPWTKSGLPQPWLGFGQISMLILPSTVLFLVLAVPAVAEWGAATAVLDANTLIGWFYCVIIAVVVTGLLTENWPWRLAGSSGRVALAATLGNVLLGTGIFFAMRPLTEFLLGPADVAALGPAVPSFPAQLGVCWVFWMILWQNCFANKPDGLPAAGRYAARIVVTLLLGIGTFFLYFHVLAGGLLHEPPMTENIDGNALGWMDWMVLWTLFYVLCLQSWGLPKPATT